MKIHCIICVARPHEHACWTVCNVIIIIKQLFFFIASTNCYWLNSFFQLDLHAIMNSDSLFYSFYLLFLYQFFKIVFLFYIYCPLFIYLKEMGWWRMTEALQPANSVVQSSMNSTKRNVKTFRRRHSPRVLPKLYRLNGIVVVGCLPHEWWHRDQTPPSLKLVHQWLLCQVLGISESALGLVSVYCDWVR